MSRYGFNPSPLKTARSYSRLNVNIAETAWEVKKPTVIGLGRTPRGGVADAPVNVATPEVVFLSGRLENRFK